MTELLGLFFTSFLAGSFVPMGSEAHLLYLYSKIELFWSLLIIATLGNTLGGMTCYYIAYYGGRPLIKRWLKIEDKRIEIWRTRLSGKGEIAAILCWLPFVGEVIAAVIGLLSNRAFLVFFFMFFGKGLRYALVLKAGDLAF